jgi:hypothetical protein
MRLPIKEWDGINVAQQDVVAQGSYDEEVAEATMCVWFIKKLDFEKACDKVEHNVILKVISHKGFPPRWINWIKGTLSSGTSSMLLNGVPGKIFHYRRGVRKSDPLSPLLFVLTTDLLQSIVNKVMATVILKLSIEVGYTNDFPIIQYADDI